MNYDTGYATGKFSDIFENNTLYGKEIELRYRTSGIKDFNDCFKSFTGIIREIKQINNRRFSITAEDKQSGRLFAKIPQARTDNNKLIPIQYGYNKNASAVTDSVDNIQFDSAPIGGPVTQEYAVGQTTDAGFLKVGLGNTYVNIPEFVDIQTLEDWQDQYIEYNVGELQWEYDESSQTARLLETNLSLFDRLQVIHLSRSNNITIKTYHPTEQQWLTPGQTQQLADLDNTTPLDPFSIHASLDNINVSTNNGPTQQFMNTKMFKITLEGAFTSGDYVSGRVKNLYVNKYKIYLDDYGEEYGYQIKRITPAGWLSTSEEIIQPDGQDGYYTDFLAFKGSPWFRLTSLGLWNNLFSHYETPENTDDVHIVMDADCGRNPSDANPDAGFDVWPELRFSSYSDVSWLSNVLSNRVEIEGYTWAEREEDVTDGWISCDVDFNHLSEIQIMQTLDIEGIADRNFYGRISGRIKSDGEVLTNPIDIMADIAKTELGIDIDPESYQDAIDQHIGWDFAFSIVKKTDPIKLIEEIASFTLTWPHITDNGTLGFITPKHNYVLNDWESAKEIKTEHIRSYKINRTEMNKVYTQVKTEYDYSEQAGEYSAYTDTLTDGDGTDMNYGISIPNLKELQCPYTQDGTTANKINTYLYNQHRHPHILLDLKLGTHYLDLELGQIVKITQLIDGVKAYGVDYTKLDWPGYGPQYRYPLFIITSIIKSETAVDVQLYQLHKLTDEENAHTSWNELPTNTGEPGEIIVPPDDISVPTILVNGENTTIFYGPDGNADYTVPTATAYDQIDGDITDQITIEWNKTTNSYWYNTSPGYTLELNSGTYLFRYTVTNSTEITSMSLIMVIVVADNVNPELDITTHANGLYDFGSDGVMNKHIVYQHGQNYYDRWVNNPNEYQAQQYGITIRATDEEEGGLSHLIWLGSEIEQSEYFGPDNEVVMEFDQLEVGSYQAGAYVEDSAGGFDFKQWEVQVVSGAEFQLLLEGTTGAASGDINADGVLNILDIVLAANFILGQAIPTDQELLAGDLNQDGTINVLDILLIVNRILDED